MGELRGKTPLRGAVLGRAELLRILVHLPEAEWAAAARATGFALRQEKPAPPPEKRQAAPVPRPAPAEGPAASAPPQPYRPGDLPDLPFWRVAAHRLLSEEESPSGAPEWLRQTPPWKEIPQSDASLTIPAAPPLVPLARQARFLRQQLVQSRPGPHLDLIRLCRQLAEQRLPPRLPRQARAVWPGRLRLLIDLSPGLRPFQSDFWRWSEQLQHLLGQRLQRLHSRSGLPDEARDVESGQLVNLEQGEAPLLLLSDAGLYAPESPRHRAWQVFAAACVRRGLRPWLLAPCPPRRLSAEFTAAFRCVLLERGASLQLQARRPAAHGPAQSTAANPSTATTHAATADLLAALALGARTEPPLLRELRLSLAPRGADIGCEYEVWNHPDVFADELACALRPGPRSAARRHFDALPEPLRQTLAQRRQLGHRHLSPLVQLEEQLVAGELAGEDALAAARRAAENYAATLFHSGSESLRQPLSGYIAALGRRRPELLAASPALAQAWGLAHRQELAAGRLAKLPAGMGLQHIAWLTTAPERQREVILGQQGAALGIFAESADAPCCPLIRLQTDSGYWQLVPERGDAAAPLVQPLGQTLPLQTEQRYVLSLGRHRLELDAVRRPAWAVGMGRDGAGLFAELADGRRVYWREQGRMRVAGVRRQTVSEERDGEDWGGSDTFALPHGYWWDAAEYRQWLAAGRWLHKPAWASAHGVDQSGWWAEFSVKGVTQRMRWIPPGEFLMGSPPEEVDRNSGGEYGETQHPVVLTQGYWLADTACTQALWQAVLGEEPSRFKGVERPVERVSWENITEKFLPALNALLPGLNLGLPTDAQWEYACRAGTRTPFSFGANITPEQVNFDGRNPYAEGKKGLYREETVDVKALPANTWGLYQMHGNVLEWCVDWLGAYPSGAVTDPEGPSAGRARVLRGGSWFYHGRYCRSAERFGFEPAFRSDGIGFRLVRGFSPKEARGGAAAGLLAWLDKMLAVRNWKNEA